MVSCQDQISEEVAQIPNNNETGSPSGENQELDDPVITPPNQLCSPSAMTFLGLKSYSQLLPHSLVVHWDPHPDAKAYILFKVENNQLEFINHFGANKRSSLIENLVPQTPYLFLIRAIDAQGKIDQNNNKLSVTTPADPMVANNLALSVNGNQSVALGPSDNYFTHHKFTLSLWFKTSLKQNDKRLVNFHRSDNGSTAINLHVNGEEIGIGYHNSTGQYETVLKKKKYYDNQWHHLVAIYNGRTYQLFYDGQKIAQKNGSFSGFRSHAAIIGAFTNVSYAFNGLIDEFSAWNINFGPFQVKELYNNKKASDLSLHPLNNELKSWIRFGDVPGDTYLVLNDVQGLASGSGNNTTAQSIVNNAP
jgi:hypothetical protein